RQDPERRGFRGGTGDSVTVASRRQGCKRIACRRGTEPRAVRLEEEANSRSSKLTAAIRRAVNVWNPREGDGDACQTFSSRFSKSRRSARRRSGSRVHPLVGAGARFVAAETAFVIRCQAQVASPLRI